MIPEALSPNDLTLPTGAERDKCNHYFGRKLEPTLYRYPCVAFALPFWRIHGKKALRKRLGPQVTILGRIKYVESEPSEKPSFARRAYWRVCGWLAAGGESLAKTIRSD